MNQNLDAQESIDLLQGANNNILFSIGQQLLVKAQEGGAGAMANANMRNAAAPRKAKAKATVAKEFCSSLEVLIKKISGTTPHFVRCIKPNAEKVPYKLEANMVYEQLLNSGVFECVRIRKDGFPMRLDFSTFFAKYKAILPPAV